MNIRQKLLAFGAISILAAATLGGVGLLGESRQNQALARSDASMVAIRNHMDGDMMHDALRADVLAALLVEAGDKAAAERVLEDIAEHSKRFRTAIDNNLKLPLDAELHSAISDLRPTLETYIASAEAMTRQALESPQQAKARLPQFLKAFSELEDRNEALSDLIEANAARSREASSATMRHSVIWLVSGIAIAASLLLLGMLRLIRSILQPLGTTMEIARRIAQGDLTTQIQAHDRDETGQLQGALADMRDNLRAMILAIGQESSALLETADTLNNASRQLVESTGQQSDSASSMASATEQMITNIAQIAEHARSAQEISWQSERLASEGGEVILGVVDGMQGIAEAVNRSSQTITALGQSSEEIHSIIQVINSIAEQTNLLALNAAIEAARAGEAGRGFAVVADEVRGLAARTAQSTQEITEMIERIRESTGQAVGSMQTGVSRVSQGVELATRAGDSIQQIRQGAKHAAAVVEEISHTIGEQSKASQEVAQQVELIARMSQDNTTTMRQLATTAQRLGHVARNMQTNVVRFRL